MAYKIIKKGGGGEPNPLENQMTDCRWTENQTSSN